MANREGRAPAARPSRPLRTFIAVPLPAETLDGLRDLQRTLGRRVPDGVVRWVRPEGIHLTLRFLGDTPTDRLPAVQAALSAVARNASAFTISVGGVGCFPNARRPRVIWVGVNEPDGRLESLQSGIEEALGRVGFLPEGRDFSPHLTLGRISRKASRDDAARVGEVVTGARVAILGEVRAARVELIRSVLKPAGAEYSTPAPFILREP